MASSWKPVVELNRPVTHLSCDLETVKGYYTFQDALIATLAEDFLKENGIVPNRKHYFQFLLARNSDSLKTIGYLSISGSHLSIWMCDFPAPGFQAELCFRLRKRQILKMPIHFNLVKFFGIENLSVPDNIFFVLFMACVVHRFKKIHEAIDSADVFGWTAASASN